MQGDSLPPYGALMKVRWPNNCPDNPLNLLIFNRLSRLKQAMKLVSLGKEGSSGVINWSGTHMMQVGNHEKIRFSVGFSFIRSAGAE